MPRPSARLDLLLLPAAPEAVPDAGAFDDLVAVGQAQGWLQGRRLVDDQLVVGGARRMWLDIPGRVRLYANQQGGFRVSCPQQGGTLVSAFQAAMGALRDGGERALGCPICGERHALEALAFRPAAGFASGAVILADAASSELAQGAGGLLAPILGPDPVLVYRRVA